MPSTATSNGRTSKTHWLGFFVAYNVTQVACLCAHDDGECQAKILFFHMFTFSMKYIHTIKGRCLLSVGFKECYPSYVGMLSEGGVVCLSNCFYYVRCLAAGRMRHRISIVGWV